MSWFRDIRSRVLLLGGVVAAGSLGVGAATLAARSASEDHFEAAHAANRALRTHLEADDLHDVVRGDVYALVTARSDDAIGRLRERVTRSATGVRRAVTATKAALHGRAELHELSETASEKLLLYADVADEIAAFAAEDRLAAVSRLGDFLGAYDEAAQASGALTAAVEAWIEASRRVGERRILRANLAALAVALVLCLATGTLLLALTRQVRSSLRGLEHQVDRVTEGDLTPLEGAGGDDELGRLARRLSGMTVGLRDLVGNVAAAAEVLGASANAITSQSSSLVGSAQAQSTLGRQADTAVREVVSQTTAISESSSSLSGSCEESAVAHRELHASSSELAGQAAALSTQAERSVASVREVASAITQIAEAVSKLTQLAEDTGASTESVAGAAQQVSKAAEEAASLAAAVDQTALEGRERSQKAQEGLRRARDSEVATRKSVEALRHRAEEIRGILDLMDEVTAETNLLALNAAIISAQAGENGRGFAVVADQIREMADRARENSGSIRGIVEGVEEDTQSAAALAEKSCAVIEAEVENAQQAAEALELIGTKARQSSSRAREIAQAVGTQAKLCEAMMTSARGMIDTAQEMQRAIDAQKKETPTLLSQSEELGSIGLAVLGASEEQAQGSQHLAAINQRVSDASQGIDVALQEQRGATGGLAQLLSQLASASQDSQQVAEHLDAEARALQDQAMLLKSTIDRFSV